MPPLSSSSPQIRSLYRSLLRELPTRPFSTPSPLHQRIRHAFSSPTSNPPSTSASSLAAQLEQTEQYLQYAKAQRMYATLLERYNPGMGIDQEERVRLTARRVGMEIPEEMLPGGRRG